MKYLLNITFLLLISSFLFVSCEPAVETSADQLRIETLSAGAWSLTSSTLNGVERDFGGVLVYHTQTHGYCQVVDGDCNGSNAYVLELDNNGGTITGSAVFTYKMHEEGTKMTITTIETTTNGVTTPCSSNCSYEFTVLEWSNTKHVLETVDSNGDVWTRTMERL